MLMQSHLGKPNERIVELLPALPHEWKTGSISGITSLGGFVFDLSWENGKLKKATVYSKQARTLLLKLRPDMKAPSSTVDFTLCDSVLKYSFAPNESATFNFD